MRSRARKRGRRRPIDVGLALWALFVVNVALGIWLSPVSAVRTVRVTGAAPNDRAYVETELQALRDRPLASVNPWLLRSRLSLAPEAAGASLWMNPFGRAVVALTPRTPVARLAAKGLWLDEAGRMFRSSVERPGLPFAALPPSAFQPGATLLAGWPSLTVAKLCRKVSAQIPNVEWTVAVNERGVLSLKAEAGTEIGLGSAENLEEKVDRLAALLRRRPDLLQKARSIDVSVPDAPMVVPD